jgi:uncharacterized protein YbbC (DUF1343 family)
MPFEQLGAPWLDTAAVLARLQRTAPAGVRFAGTTFTPVSPGDGKYADTLVYGIRLITSDRTSYDPTVTAVHLLAVLKAVHPNAFAFRPAQFDRLAGGPDLRLSIERGDAVRTIVGHWTSELEQFKQHRRQFLLYPE